MNPALVFPALSGVLFGAGLVISGLADPAKIIGFLTLAPGWDPALLFVMIGALVVTVPGFALVRRRGQPLFAGSLSGLTSGAIDRPLLLGAAVFGLGWGLQGYCPGPAVVAAGLLQWPALVFLPAMLLGAWLSDRMPTMPSRNATTLDPSARKA